MSDKRVALADVPAGETVRVCAIEGGHVIHDRLLALGIRAGVRVTKVSNLFTHGPIVITHGQTQTALGRGICLKIFVEV